MFTKRTTDQRTAEHRAAVIAGLRALADFLTANPAIPLPINPITVADAGRLPELLAQAHRQRGPAAQDLPGI